MTARERPLLQLIRDLAGSGRARDWPERAASHRGPWTRVAGDALEWPPYLPPVPESSTGIWWFSRRSGFFDHWFRRWRSSSRPAIPAQPAADLASTLMECHLWLARKNLAHAARWFHPLHGRMPAGLMEISDQGLLWALVVTHARTWGTRDLQGVLAEVQQIERLSSRTTLGDCVALHVLLEEWIAETAASRSIAVDAETQRRAGGLRLPETLRSLPALRLREPQWSRAFDALAACSPLTLLVYADLFDTTGRTLPRFAPLFRMEAPGSLELWISHLARSLLAACTSPAPAEERRQRAELAYQDALAAARARWSATFGSTAPEHNGAVVAARAAHDRIAESCRGQLWQRTTLLAAIARDSLFFHLRFLDFLVRHAVTACDDAMKKQWTARSRDRDDLYDEPRDVFFFEGRGHTPICRHMLERLLWGREGDVPPPELQTAVAQAWSALRPPQLGVEQILASASVSATAAERLAKRYELDPIPLSIRGKWSHPPHDVWSDWSSVIGNRMHASEAGAAE